MQGIISQKVVLSIIAARGSLKCYEFSILPVKKNKSADLGRSRAEFDNRYGVANEKFFQILY
jgi:hypothetical protein